MDDATKPGGYSSVTNTAVRSAERLIGAASLLSMLEEKAETGGTITSPELSAIRCIVETCANDLDATWQ